MTTNTNLLLNWLKNFQTVWLPENIPDDTRLLQSVRTKLHEFEQIIIDNHDNEEEYHRARLLNDHSSSDSDAETIPIASTSTHELPTGESLNLLLPQSDDDDDNNEEQARQILLEQSDASEKDDDDETILLRPSICIKRISQAEAERYKPLAWRKENIPSKKRSDRNSTTSSDGSTSGEDVDDYRITYRTRNSPSNKTEKSSTSSRQQTRNSHKKSNEIYINYRPSAILDEPVLEDSITIAQDISPMDQDRLLKDVIENNDNDSIFASLDIAQDNKPAESNSIEPMEDPSNDRSSTAEDSPDDRAQIDVPSYAHLLDHSKVASSDSDDSKKKSSSKDRTKSKRLITSDSDKSPRKKKSKRVTRHRAALSSLSSSSSDENENASSNRGDSSPSPKTARRLRIQRSSSDSSNKHSRKKRKESGDSSSRKERKRKTSKSSSDSDASDQSENSQNISPSKGRKNIRKILDDKELDDQTKNAIAAERERRKRIAENQQKYNESVLDQSVSLPDELTPTSDPRLILELDKATNEPLIEVAPKLVAQMKPHQCDGVRFLWNNVFESLEAIRKTKQAGNGCILAHCMGLGKTLQVISFIHTVFNYDTLTKVKTCLVLCPINAALNWTNEFDYWLNGIEPPVEHYQLTTIKKHLRLTHLSYWYETGGVMIMGYDMYRRLASGINIKNKTTKEQLFKCLVDPGPDIIVADEGHILKNAQTALAKCLTKIKTRRRIVLTGTPLQNNLIEYYCMVSFIKPNLLGSQSEYINRFVNPIQNGQHRDSNEEDVRLMKRRACVLHELLTGFVDRKDYSLLKEYLPPKYEYIIKIRLSDLQSKLYELYLEKLVNKEQRLSTARKDFHSAKLFADFQYLQKIWTHPFLLYPYFIDHWKKQDDDSSIDDTESEIMFLDDEENMSNKKKKNNEPTKSVSKNNYSGFLIDNVKTEDANIQATTVSKRRLSSSSTTTLDSDSEENGSNSKEGDKGDDDDAIEVIKVYPTRSRTTIIEKEKSPVVEDTSDEPWLNEMREQFWFPFLDLLPPESEFDIELSGKFLLLKYILDKCTEIGDKVIVFSRSLLTLNHIEKFLHHLHQQNAKEYESQREYLSANDENANLLPEPIRWKRDADYFRMDGQTEVTARKRYTKAFNDTSNIRARLFLISTLAGGIGINLVGSNRVIVFDASWNPSHDTQAIFRSYRFGQKKPVYIYRFLAHGTMEEKIYQRQVVKQSLSQRVIDDHQLDRHFTQNDIQELYKFQPEKLPDAQTTSTPLNFNYAIPKDHLLLDLLYEHNRWIHSYHSHDSLLENKIDEGLTADERRRALEEYENLKRLPDQRQAALQRLQQQQRLNYFIAQQHLAAQQQQPLDPRIAQLYQAFNGQQIPLLQMLQSMQTNGVRLATPHHNPVPIRPRVMNSAETITVDSDEDQPRNIASK